MAAAVNMLALIALFYILVKIPFWILAPLKISHSRSFAGGLARSFVLGRALGLIGGPAGLAAGHRLGHRTGRTAGVAGAARTGGGGPARGWEPPWPAPIREWGGVDGLSTPEAIRRRLHARQAAERARAGTSPGVAPVPFQQPAPQVPTHDLATTHATSAPAASQFRTAEGTVHTPAATPVTPPMPRRRSSPPRRYPPFSTSGAPTARRPVPAPVVPAMRTAAAPPKLRFQPARPDPVHPPVRATAAPAAPVFHPPVADPGSSRRRARSHTPAPVVFQHPAAPPPRTSPPVFREPPPPADAPGTSRPTSTSDATRSRRPRGSA